jgi:hypothetical protein
VASLVVLKFDTPDGAEKGLELAVSLQKQQLLHIKDAAPCDPARSAGVHECPPQSSQWTVCQLERLCHCGLITRLVLISLGSGSDHCAGPFRSGVRDRDVGQMALGQ